MGQGEWTRRVGIGKETEELLWTQNPAATMTPSDCDWDEAMEPLQEEEPAERIFKLLLEKEEEPWFATDMAALIRSWNEPSIRKLGAKA
jgi:hypothetical protein